MRNAISCEGLKVSINGREILKGIDLEVPEGKIISVLGPSGAGKSTLLRCINRLIDYVPKAKVLGKIEVLGMDVFSTDPCELRRIVGTVFQEPNPLPHLAIFENVALPIRLNRKTRRKEIPGLVERYLRMAMLWEEVKDRLHDFPQNLSGGQQQRLCLARALALEPKVLLLDEPTANIDEENAMKIEKCIKELAKSGVTVLLVTHSVSQAERVSDEIVVLRKGKIAKRYSPKKLGEREISEALFHFSDRGVSLDVLAGILCPR